MFKCVYTNFDFIQLTFQTALSPLGHTVYILHQPIAHFYLQSKTHNVETCSVFHLTAAPLKEFGFGIYLEPVRSF